MPKGRYIGSRPLTEAEKALKPIVLDFTNPIIVSGPAEVLIEAFFGPKQHDQHMQMWRWHCYTTGNYHYSPEYSNRIIYGARA